MAPSPSPSDDVVQTGGTGKVDSATKASAIAFTGKLLDALDEGGANGNFAKALALFDKTCTTCKAGIAYAQSIYAKNQKIVGGQYNNPKYSVLASPVADVIVRVDSTVAAYRVVNASGKTVGSAKSQDNIANYHLKKSGSSWLVVRWSQS